MSVAFTKEEDSESQAANLPDRPISAHRNLVTPRGLALLDEGLSEARAAYAAAQAGDEISADRTAMARATRDLRYYGARRGSAQLVDTPDDPQTVVFGVTVTFEREDGRRSTYRIVGEDEADPGNGAVSYVSPLARALLGKSVGDEANVGEQTVEILAVTKAAD
jgi:transcription elongation GreA/GreB family factor